LALAGMFRSRPASPCPSRSRRHAKTPGPCCSTLRAGLIPKLNRKRHEMPRQGPHRTLLRPLIETFIAKHVSSLRTGRDVEAAIRRELIPVLGKKPIASITRRDIVHLLESVVESGRPYTARHLLAYLSKFFVWAISRDCYGIAGSPCVGIKAADIIGQLKPRQRVLTDSELMALWKATAGLSYPAGASDWPAPPRSGGNDLERDLS
jgi:hypothetical protein